MKTYNPSPLDTQNVSLPKSLDELTEKMARNVHEIWAQGRIAEGWRYGEQRDDRQKTHPCLVPYEELPESEREYDRKTAVQTLKMITKLGFKIRKEQDISDCIKCMVRRFYWALGGTVFIAVIGICALVFLSMRFPYVSWLTFVLLTLVVICTLCWLGSYCRYLLTIYNETRKQFVDTELSLYKDSIRREGVICDEQTTQEQIAIRLETKRKELELAKIERELKTMKE